MSNRLIYTVFLLLFIISLLVSPLQVFSKCPGCLDAPTKGKLVILYFYKEGDPICIETTYLLKTIVANYPYLELEMKDISNPEVRDLRNILDKAYGLKGIDVMSVPAIFVGKDVFIGYNTIYNGLKTSILDGIPKPKKVTGRIIFFFRTIKISNLFTLGRFLWLIVIIAGLIDGINPCALSVLIFLISSILLKSREVKPILVTGMSFTIGSFVAYFIIGLGLLNFIQGPFFDRISNWFYPSLGALSFLFGGLSLVDFYKAKTDRVKEIKLQLPRGLKKMEHKLVRTHIKSIRVSVILGLSLGFLLSLLEFVCTGQIYLPTVTLIGNPWTGARPILYLVLYNLMFILPLGLVVLTSAFFISSNQISSLLSKNLSITKLLTACLFFILSGYMFGLL
jgi:cytochrome c biogenesis protein CcdA